MRKTLFGLAAIGALACTDTVDVELPRGHIRLDPGVMFLAPGETKTVMVRVYGPSVGDLIHADVSLAATAGLSARIDSTFRQVYGPDGSLMPFPEATEQRMIVTMAPDGAAGRVTVTAGEISVELPVHRRP